MDKKILQDQLAGLEAKGKELRAKERLFLKAQGLDEQLETSRAEAADLETQIAEIKETIKEKKAAKAAALDSTAEALAVKMGDVLAEGKAVFRIEDGAVILGWQNPEGVFVPHGGLSGGQEKKFEAALSYALLGNGEKITIIEAAEVDGKHLAGTLEWIAAEGKGQFIVNAWRMPEGVPEGWEVVRL